MAKSKDRSEIEYMRGLIKNLKAEVRNLKKQVARHNKRAHQYEDLEERQAEVEVADLYTTTVTSKIICKSCSSDKMEEVSLGVKKLIVCRDCGKRETKKNA